MNLTRLWITPCLIIFWTNYACAKVDMAHGRNFLLTVPDTLTGCSFMLQFISVQENASSIMIEVQQKYANGQISLTVVETAAYKANFNIQQALSNPLVTVTSAADISVTLDVWCYQISYQFGLYRLLPMDHWGKEYLVALPTDLLCATVTLLSKVDVTVQMDLRKIGASGIFGSSGAVVIDNGGSIRDNGTYFLALAAQQRYQVTAFMWDMTGTRFSAAKPFSVVVGPSNLKTTEYHCDTSTMVMEQLMPTHAWGLVYLVPANSAQAVTVTVVAVESQTIVNYWVFDDSLLGLSASASSELVESGEALTYHFANGQTYDVISSTRPVMVVCSYSVTSGGSSSQTSGLAFTQIAPLSRSPDKVHVTITASTLFKFYAVSNVNCTIQTSSYRNQYTHIEHLVINDTYRLTLLSVDHSQAYDTLELFSVDLGPAFPDCSGLLTTVTATLAATSNAIAAYPAAWSLCPEDQEFNVTTRTCYRVELPSPSAEPNYPPLIVSDSTTPFDAGSLEETSVDNIQQSSVPSTMDSILYQEETTTDIHSFEENVTTNLQFSSEPTTTASIDIVEATTFDQWPQTESITLTTEPANSSEEPTALNTGSQVTSSNTVAGVIGAQSTVTDPTISKETTAADTGNTWVSVNRASLSTHETTTKTLSSHETSTSLADNFILSTATSLPEQNGSALPQMSDKAKIQCPCRCSTLNGLPFNEKIKMSQTKALQWSQQLRVNREELARTRQKKESARDERSASVTVGALGIGFIVSSFGLIVCIEGLEALDRFKHRHDKTKSRQKS